MPKKTSHDNSGRLSPSTLLLALLRQLRHPKNKLREFALRNLKVGDDEIKAVGPVLQRISWSDASVREQIENYGVKVLPINFYSNTPSFEDIRTSFEYNEADAPYLSERVFDPGILKRTLAEITQYCSEFNPVLDGDETHCQSFFWKNPQFSYSDAMAYYCFVRKLKPKTIIEIGSGFSSLIAIEALKRNEYGKLICIEPFPRPFLDTNTWISLVKQKAQELTAEYLNDTLQDGDILFIDSTHTVKTGSDCLHIYLRLLPSIQRNIHVHVHDVFLPFGMPKQWLQDNQTFWTEQYLLLALITDNPRARVCYGSAYHHAFNKELLDRMMNNKYPSGGGSFWFEYAADEAPGN